MTTQLQKRVEKSQALGEHICRALSEEIKRLHLAEEITPPSWAEATFRVHRDPALGNESLEALWLHGNGIKLGSATLHDDGSFFAEYDIIRPHPHKTKWFVEAVTAWGRNDDIKSEARLLPALE